MKIDRAKFLQQLDMVKAGLSPREFIEQSSCCSADTVLHTLEGDFTIRQLMSQGKTSFSVFSTDGKRLRIGQATDLRLTRQNADVVQVLFDTGHSIKLTADHLVMLRDGSYLPAGQLQQGDSVMPFNRHFCEGYPWIYPNMHTGRKRIHVWAFEQYHGRKPVLVHHKDENTWNNLESNLEETSRVEHGRFHSLKDPPMHKPGAAEAMSKAMMGNKNGRFGKGVAKPGLMENRNAVGSRGGGCTSEGAKLGWEKRRANGIVRSRPNHRVVSVIPAGKEDVYDLSVEKYHNFAANGIFVHNCFVFQEGWVMTFNDEVACRMKLELPVEGAVQASQLLEILGKLTQEEMTVVEMDSGELEFQGNHESFAVVKDAQVFLPIGRVEAPKRWEKLDPLFTAAVSTIRHCVSTDQSRFLLTCVHITDRFVEACDNHQVMRFYTETPCITESVLVRGTSLEPLAELAMDRVALTKSWIHFRNATGLIYSCRRYTEEYPELGEILKVKGHELILPKTLGDTTDRAQVFSADKTGDSLVSVTLSNDRIRVKGEGLSGWYKADKEVVYEGPELNFLIAPELLKLISTKYQEAVIGADKLLATGEGWRYVTVLGKPDDAPAKPAAKPSKKRSEEPVED